MWCACPGDPKNIDARACTSHLHGRPGQSPPSAAYLISCDPGPSCYHGKSSFNAQTPQLSASIDPSCGSAEVCVSSMIVSPTAIRQWPRARQTGSSKHADTASDHSIPILPQPSVGPLQYINRAQQSPIGITLFIRHRLTADRPSVTMAYSPYYANHERNNPTWWIWGRFKSLFTGVSFYAHRGRPRFAFSRNRDQRGDRPAHWQEYHYEYNQQPPMYSSTQHNSAWLHHPNYCVCQTGYASSSVESSGSQPNRTLFQPMPPYGEYAVDPFPFSPLGSTSSAHSLHHFLYSNNTGRRVSPPPKYVATPVASLTALPAYSTSATLKRPVIHRLDVRQMQGHSTGGSFIIPPGAHEGRRSTAPLTSAQSLLPTPTPPTTAPPVLPAKPAAASAPRSVLTSVVSCPSASPSHLQTDGPPHSSHGRAPGNDDTPVERAKNPSISRASARAANAPNPLATLSQPNQPSHSTVRKGSPLGRLFRRSYSEPSISPRSTSRRHREHRDSTQRQISTAPLSPIQKDRSRVVSRSAPVQGTPLQEAAPRSTSPRHYLPRRQVPPTPPPTPVSSHNGAAQKPHGRRTVGDPVRSPPSAISTPRLSQSGSDSTRSIHSQRATTNPSEQRRRTSFRRDEAALRAKIVRDLESKRTTSSSIAWSGRTNSDFSGFGNGRDAFERRDHFNLPCGSEMCEA